VRKKRACTGYRQEEDIVFRTETPQIVKKAKAKKTLGLVTAADERSFALRYPSLLAQKPSRRADLDNEAVLHFMVHYDERFFYGRTGGVDYLTPVLEADSARGGPVADIITACGLATLGSMKNCPDLVMQANVRKTKVLRQLQTQLQDPQQALTNSSVLTCLFLGSLEVSLSPCLARFIACGVLKLGIVGRMQRPRSVCSIYGASQGCHRSHQAARSVPIRR